MCSIAHNFEDRTRTKDVLINEELNFNALLLAEQTLIGLHKSGFRVPSPIQLKAIPIGKCGFDLIIKSKSGTGKTVVFSTIALELINTKKNAVQVLILTPTREIAVQIQDVLKLIGKEFTDLKVESFIGGFPVDEDVKKLSKCHIAVGAPGRIKHLLQLGALNPNEIKLFVLDEADKLINSDIKVDIDYISKKLPATKQVVASSATYSDEVITYLDVIMLSPTLVEPNTDTPLLLGLKQYVTVVKSNLNVVHQLNIKNEELIKLLSQITFSQCLVFTNYQSRAETISNTLNRKGWKTMYISAAQNQSERLKIINLLKEGNCRILLSTDITARGIDAANIDLVINYDVPYEASTYLHRMGRAGRFGSHGVCITIAAFGKDLYEYQKILGTIGGANVFVPQLPKDGNLPDDLWNADSTGFELVQGIIDDSTKSANKLELTNSIMDLKIQRNNLKKYKSKSNQDNETSGARIEKENSDDVQAVHCSEQSERMEHSQSMDEIIEGEESSDVMPFVKEGLLNSSKEREGNLKSKFTSLDTQSLLQDLATGCESLNLSSEQQHPDDVVEDTSKSKTRKRKFENIPYRDETTVSMDQNLQNEKEIMYKNVALLNATKLLYESYDTDQVTEELISSLDSHLKRTSENKFKNLFESHSKEEILNLIASGEVENLLSNPSLSQNDFSKMEDVHKFYQNDLEDIFKLSYDYAVNSGKTHWLDVLGEELEEKMSLTDNLPEDDSQPSFSSVHDSSTELPKRRKHRTYKKKTFKDFTHKSKKYVEDLCSPTLETYNAHEVKESTNKVDANLYYQADHEYANNEHFASHFDCYSNELTEKLQTFEDVASFETWFAEWQWQVYGIRDYVQQNIYLQEMNRYAYNRQS